MHKEQLQQSDSNNPIRVKPGVEINGLYPFILPNKRREITMTNNEIFAMYIQSLNQQTQALQQGFAQMMQVQAQQTNYIPPAQPNIDALVQQQVNALMPELMKQAAAAVSQVNEVHSPILPVQPVMEDVVDQPKPQEYILGETQYDMYLRIEKPCTQCPFANRCDLKASHISNECGVMDMKNAAASAGEIQIEVAMDQQLMKTTYRAYKDGMYIGVLAENKENKTLRTELEKYVGYTVRLMTQLKRNVPNSTFTGLYAEILGTLEVQSPVQPIATPEPPVQPEANILDLGEIVLPI